MNNIDTDFLCPAQFLYTVHKTGLADCLLYEMRHDASGRRLPDFVLNRAPYNAARILVVGDNFGSGSSREHAVWALKDFGIQCVVALSFADIFFNNALKNGLLLVSLPPAKQTKLLADISVEDRAWLTVDLQEQTIANPGGEVIHFEIDAFRKEYLMSGRSGVADLERDRERVRTYEAQASHQRPWLFQDTLSMMPR